MAAEPTRRLFTVDEYYRMLDAGILQENDRVELIEGEIIEMAPVSAPHASCVKRFNRLFMLGLGEAVILSIHDPVRLGTRSEPVPDVAVLRAEADFYRSGHPTPTDALLVVEVSDTTLSYDQNTKLPLYARSGVPEVWIADLLGDAIRGHREPTPDGYRVVFIRRRGERISLAAFPDVDFAVEDLLG